VLIESYKSEDLTNFEKKMNKTCNKKSYKRMLVTRLPNVCTFPYLLERFTSFSKYDILSRNDIEIRRVVNIILASIYYVDVGESWTGSISLTENLKLTHYMSGWRVCYEIPLEKTFPVFPRPLAMKYSNEMQYNDQCYK